MKLKFKISSLISLLIISGVYSAIFCLLTIVYYPFYYIGSALDIIGLSVGIILIAVLSINLFKERSELLKEITHLIKTAVTIE